MGVPLFASSLEPYHDRLAARLSEVAASGRYILGPEVEAFERDFADYLGVEHCVGVGNGTDALVIALQALGVGPGDEVVVPSFTFYATAEAVAAIGATPVFCDVDPDTFCLTPQTVEPAVGERTKAIVPVHLFGRLAPIEDLRQFGVPLLEDAAQAAGAAAGRDEGRRARGRGDVLVLPVEEPALPRRRRRDRHERRRARGARAQAAPPRLDRQADPQRGGLELAPRRAPGGGSAGVAAGARWLERCSPGRCGALRRGRPGEPRWDGRSR